MTCLHKATVRIICKNMLSTVPVLKSAFISCCTWPMLLSRQQQSLCLGSNTGKKVAVLEFQTLCSFCYHVMLHCILNDWNSPFCVCSPRAALQRKDQCKQHTMYGFGVLGTCLKKPHIPGYLSASRDLHPGSGTLLSKPILHLPAERPFALTVYSQCHLLWWHEPSVSLSKLFCDILLQFLSKQNNSQLGATLAFWFTACLGLSSWSIRTYS